MNATFAGFIKFLFMSISFRWDSGIKSQRRMLLQINLRNCSITIPCHLNNFCTKKNASEVLSFLDPMNILNTLSINFNHSAGSLLSFLA